MLVLTRKRAEMIKIGEDIVIKVIQTGRGTVKLGIEAPSHVRVLRAELTELPAGMKIEALAAAEDDDEDDEEPAGRVAQKQVTDFLADFDSSGALSGGGGLGNGPLRRLMTAAG